MQYRLPYLFVAPEHHYIDKDQTICMYHNMHTGEMVVEYTGEHTLQEYQDSPLTSCRLQLRKTIQVLQ